MELGFEARFSGSKVSALLLHFRDEQSGSCSVQTAWPELVVGTLRRQDDRDSGGHYKKEVNRTDVEHSCDVCS